MKWWAVCSRYRMKWLDLTVVHSIESHDLTNKKYSFSNEIIIVQFIKSRDQTKILSNKMINVQFLKWNDKTYNQSNEITTCTYLQYEMIKVSNEVIQLNGHPDVQGTESNDQTCSLWYKMIKISTKRSIVQFMIKASNEVTTVYRLKRSLVHFLNWLRWSLVQFND